MLLLVQEKPGDVEDIPNNLVDLFVIPMIYELYPQRTG